MFGQTRSEMGESNAANCVHQRTNNNVTNRKQFANCGKKKYEEIPFRFDGFSAVSKPDSSVRKMFLIFHSILTARPLSSSRPSSSSFRCISVSMSTFQYVAGVHQSEPSASRSSVRVENVKT